MGKTRLALEHLASSTDGGFFCDLSDARTVEDICVIVASVIELPLLAGEDPAALVQRIGRALRGCGAPLLVVDNFEALVEHAPATVSRWLEATDETRFLATSRESL